MKAQTKALVASVAVIALALSAVSGITYSWWSDSENSDIDINTGDLDVTTSDYAVNGDGVNVSKDTVPEYIAIYYGMTGESDASHIYISQDYEPDELDLKITYKVQFESTVNYTATIATSVPAGVAYTATAVQVTTTESEDSSESQNLPVVVSGNITAKEPEFKATYNVTITITSLPMKLSSAKMTLTNEITQKAAATPVSTADDLESALTNGKDVVLSSNIALSGSVAVPDGKKASIDLNGKTLSFSSITVGADDGTDGATLNIKNGTLSGTERAHIDVRNSSTVALDGVNYTSGGHALKAYGPKAAISVNNSTVTGDIAIMSDGSRDAGQEKYGNVSITVTGSKIIGKATGGDSTAIILNASGTLTIKNSELTGERQCLAVRAGTANVENTTFNYLNKYDGSDTGGSHEYGQWEYWWGSGNQFSRAAVVAGNLTSVAYAADAELALKDCTVKINSPSGSENYAKALVVAQDSKNGKTAEVTLSGDCSTIQKSMYTNSGNSTTGYVKVDEKVTTIKMPNTQATDSRLAGLQGFLGQYNPSSA